MARSFTLAVSQSVASGVPGDEVLPGVGEYVLAQLKAAGGELERGGGETEPLYSVEIGVLALWLFFNNPLRIDRLQHCLWGKLLRHAATLNVEMLEGAGAVLSHLGLEGVDLVGAEIAVEGVEQYDVLFNPRAFRGR